MNGLHVWGGLVINDEFDVSAVAFGKLTKLFACTEPDKLRFIGIVVWALPFEELNGLDIGSTPGEIAAVTVPVPLNDDINDACIWWYFFCSLSLCVSANLTTKGAEQPSIVWLWFSAYFKKKIIQSSNEWHNVCRKTTYFYGGQCGLFRWKCNECAAFALSTLVT